MWVAEAGPEKNVKEREGKDSSMGGMPYVLVGT